MIERGKRRALTPRRIAVIASALTVCLLFLLTVINSPPPTIDLAFGDTAIFIAADRDWTLFPGDCATIRWRLEGIASLHVDGRGKIGADEMRFCPEINATSPRFEIRAQNGIYRSFTLNLHHLPDLLFYLVSFVTLIGAPALAIYYFCLRRLGQPLPVSWLLLGALALTVLGAWLRLTPHDPPLLEASDEPVAQRFWAEHDRVLFPHECVKVWWSVVGAPSLRYKSREFEAELNPASSVHCAEDGDSAIFEVIEADGQSREYRLPIVSHFPHKAVPPPFFYLSSLGILLGLLIYGPLLARHLRDCRKRSARADAVSILGCFFMVFILYLPFGFDSSGHWEEWIVHGYTEGGTLSFYATEAVSRPFVMVPHTLAYLISSESFIGYHLVNFMQYAGRMALLYIILRQLGASPLYAFLAAILFMVYPVNDNLMTLRRLPKNFSVLTLLLATALFLDYCQNPRRLTLLGIWLALLFSVNSNETGYAVVLIVPLLLWARERRLSWRLVNLSAIWYIVPAFKLMSVALLLALGRDFYQSGLISAGASAESATIFDTVIEVLSIVYPQTFVHGWRDAFDSLQMNMWWLPTLVILAGVGLIAWFHIREEEAITRLTARQIGVSLASGLLLIIAAVGVLMWIPLYREDPWRMYLFVPIGAAIAVFSLILLLASPIRDNRLRNTAVAGLCLALLLPTVSRLMLQHNRFVDSAYAKARILHQIIEIAPAIAPGTQVVLLTAYNHIELGERDIKEFIADDMLNSALHVLYQDRAPEVAYTCHTMQYCGEFNGDETIFSPGAPGDLLGRTLVFALDSDYSVELVEDPGVLLGLDVAAPYDASALYEAAAPHPPRAATMLSAALET